MRVTVSRDLGRLFDGALDGGIRAEAFGVELRAATRYFGLSMGARASGRGRGE